MSDYLVSPASLSGTVNIPASKSYGHRLLIESAASGNRMVVKGNLQGDDIEATIGCLTAMGVEINRTEEGVEVLPPAKYNSAAALMAGESGSTLRFFMSLAPALDVEATFEGRGELPNRPVGTLLECLERVGVTATASKLPFTLNGSYADSPAFLLRNLKSSQDVSGLLMAMPLVKGSRLRVEGDLPSMGYVNITLETLKEFGVEYDINGGEFVPLSGYKRIKEVTAEGDWSSASFIAAAGVLTGATAIKGLKYPSAQPDSVVVELLRKAGADVSYKDGVLYACKSELRAIEFDADGCPDLVPIMATTLAFAEGTSVISGVDRLRFKESDRIATVIDLLGVFGIKAEYAEGKLYIHGGKPRGGGAASSAGDHRIAMSAAIAASAAEGEGTIIKGAECVSKSYSSFYNDLVALGGRADER